MKGTKERCRVERFASILCILCLSTLWFGEEASFHQTAETVNLLKVLLLVQRSSGQKQKTTSFDGRKGCMLVLTRTFSIAIALPSPCIHTFCHMSPLLCFQLSLWLSLAPYFTFICVQADFFLVNVYARPDMKSGTTGSHDSGFPDRKPPLLLLPHVSAA